MSYYFTRALWNESTEDDYYRYYANARDGQGAVISYSFMTGVAAGTSAPYGNPADSFRSYTNAEKATVREGLAILESVINIDFRETAGDADMKFGQFDIEDGIAGYAYYPVYDKTAGQIYNGGVNWGEVWLDSAYILDQVHLVLHEVSHGLGLKHPFEGGYILPADEDNTSNTVMSYTGSWGDDLGIFDVITLQSIYGPAKQRMGNDTYVFGEDKLIWDGGGTDLVTAAKSKQSVTIDLNDGRWNFEGSRASSFLDDSKGDQVFLGYFTRIENVTGSVYNDRLIGNELANTINGGNGNDTLQGNSGNDTLQGGSGNDLLLGGAGADRHFGSYGNDTVSYAGSSRGVTVNLTTTSKNTNDAKGDSYSQIERLQGTSHADNLYGSSGSNDLIGWAGNDRLNGAAGSDFLAGGSGRDIFHFSSKLGPSNIDVIDDFNVAHDTIWLDDDAFVGIGKVGDLLSAAFRIASKALDSSDRIIYDSNRGKLWYDADGSGKGSAIEFARLDTGLKMTAADFDILA